MKRSNFVLPPVLLTFLLISIIGCSGNDGAAGTTGPQGPAGPAMPVIQSIAAAGLPAPPNGTAQVTVNAQSAESLPLTYAWTASNGWSIASGGTSSIVTLTAPGVYGASGSASVVVSDTNNRSATGMVALSTAGNSAPIIESIAIYPQPVVTTANLLASAFDPDGDSLNYAWTIGGMPDIAFGNSATWYSPGIPGLYLATLAVSDGTSTVTGGTSVSIGSASPWPVFRRDLQGTGLSDVDTSGTSGVLQWSYTAGSSIIASPVIASDGMVYFNSADGKAHGLRPDGSLLWSFVTDNGLASAPAVAADNTIYVCSTYTNLYALRQDGSVKWNVNTNCRYSSPAIGADGTVYVGSTGMPRSLYAIRPDGGLKWKYDVGSGLYDYVDSFPVIGPDGVIYAGTTTGTLYALAPDGTLKWSAGTSGMTNESPAIGVDGTIYYSSSNRLFALRPDGTYKWSAFGGGTILTSPAIGADGTIHIGTSSGLSAFRPDGLMKWSYKTPGQMGGDPAIASDGTIYAGADKLYAIRPDGMLKWSITGAGWFSGPVLGTGGSVYVGTGSSLYAIH